MATRYTADEGMFRSRSAADPRRSASAAEPTVRVPQQGQMRVLYNTELAKRRCRSRDEWRKGIALSRAGDGQEQGRYARGHSVRQAHRRDHVAQWIR